jgi:hypothetical protein
VDRRIDAIPNKVRGLTVQFELDVHVGEEANKFWKLLGKDIHSKADARRNAQCSARRGTKAADVVILEPKPERCAISTA